MPSVLIAVLLLCVVIFGAKPASAAPSAAPVSSAPSSRTAPPLPPGSAAGIKLAQGIEWSGPLIGAAVTGGIFLAMLLLIDGDDDSGPVTNTSP